MPLHYHCSHHPDVQRRQASHRMLSKQTVPARVRHPSKARQRTQRASTLASQTRRPELTEEQNASPAPGVNHHRVQSPHPETLWCSLHGQLGTWPAGNLHDSAKLPLGEAVVRVSRGKRKEKYLPTSYSVQDMMKWLMDEFFHLSYCFSCTAHRAPLSMTYVLPNGPPSNTTHYLRGEDSNMNLGETQAFRSVSSGFERLA